MLMENKLTIDKLAISWFLTQRQLCDLELLLNGGFSPLTGFMNQDDYGQTLTNMRLANGSLWPIPITLDVSHHFAEKVKIGDLITLRNYEGVIIATMEISDKWIPDKEAEVLAVYGSTNSEHPGVNYILAKFIWEGE
jgi:sulfate adenylyltransferase